MPPIDISPTVSADLAVWPGDTPVSREVLLDMRAGDHLTLSSLHATVHVGAHADAPNHYGKDAEGIDAIPLQRYLGGCQVVRVDTRPGALITAEEVRVPPDCRRLLIATGTYPDPTEFSEDYAALDPALGHDLGRAGVQLIGVDTPSVDPFTSKELPAHRACLAEGILILEGLVLAGVAEGSYRLIALPLKLSGFDASPVRAVLLPPGESLA